MKIYYATLFFCENLILAINAYENKTIDEYHITEFDKTFQNKKKEFEFKNIYSISNIIDHQVNLGIRNRGMGIAGKLLCAPYRFSNYKILSQPQWHNDGMQRNIAQSILDPEDEDIVILSDVDEMILSEYFDEIIQLAKKKEILTIKLYFTMFYLNLYSTNWSGAPDYSYRLFVMTGKKYKEIKKSFYGFDVLRKRGEQGKLVNEIYCFPEIAGYHHSWLGDEDFINRKLHAYAHIQEHDGRSSKEFIHECVKEGKSLFPNHKLEIRHDLRDMRFVEEHKDELKQYFID